MWRIFYIDPPPRGGAHITKNRAAGAKFFLTFFRRRRIFFWCISKGNDLFREVVEKIDFSNIFCHFLPIFGHFSDIFGICWDFLGDPRQLFRRFWGNFGHFWTIFGPIFFLPFSTENPENPPKIRCVAVWLCGGFFFIPSSPRGGRGCHT